MQSSTNCLPVRRRWTQLRLETLEPRLAPAISVMGPYTTAEWTTLQASGADAFQVRLDLPASPTAAAANFSVRTALPFQVDALALSERLATVPREAIAGAGSTTGTVLTLPTPGGTFARFHVWEVNLLEPALAAQFPTFKTYRGQGVDDPTATLIADVTDLGFRAQVLSNHGNFYIDPYYHLESSAYISYRKEDLTDAHADGRAVSETPVAAPTTVSPSGTAQRPSNGQSLRTFRLAVAATGEYTAFFGGTVANAQSAIVTSVNRVSGIFERELAVRLVLVGNNSSVVYTNSSTDPYDNSNPNAMLGQNQTNLDAVIGTTNYDIGHVFSTSGGGVANLGSVGIEGVKAEGVTGSDQPVGDPYDVDFVIHEMGHQFGAEHTFNGTATSNAQQREASAAYEPGSGSTIMAYAGIMGSDNVQSNSDAYFHAKSLDQISDFITDVIPTVGTTSATGNNIPGANAGGSFTIPARTPFTLTGSGSDPDAGNVLTYGWEQYDLGPARALGATDNGSSPLFRSFTPTTDPSRTFPQLATLLSGTTSKAEVLPTTTRTLNFRLTVRDNQPTGAYASDDLALNVVNTGTAFAITSPNTKTAVPSGVPQTVTWNVAGTDTNGINVTQVNVLLSTDGGNTFSTTLAAAVPNTGSAQVTLPSLATNLARIKVEAVGNIFFDVSDQNFAITLPGPFQVASVDPIPGSVLPGPTVAFDVTFTQAVNAATVDTSDVVPSVGVVTAATVQGISVVRYTIGSLPDAPLTLTLPAGAISNTAGNPVAAFSANFSIQTISLNLTPLLTSTAPLGSLVYTASSPAGVSPLGDTDEFTLSLDAGQSLSMVVTPAAGLQPTFTLTGPGGTNLFAGASAAGVPAVLSSVPVTFPGVYTVTVGSANSTTGTYTVQALLNAAVEAEANGGGANDTLATAESLASALVTQTGNVRVAALLGTADAASTDDVFSLPLTAGAVVSLGLKGLAAGTPSMDLLDASGLVVASSTGLATNYDRTIASFVVPSAGTYFARVNGTPSVPYNLVVTTAATLDAEPNDTFGTAQLLLPGQSGVGALVTSDSDWYQVSLAANETLTVQTRTPGSGGLAFTNFLSPRLELYDPSNTLLVSNEGGNNPRIDFAASVAGLYRIRVASSGSTGEYLVQTTLSPTVIPTLTAFTPDSGPIGTVVTLTGTNFTNATAVTINGAPTNFTIDSDTTIQATIPSFAQSGPFTVTVLASSVTTNTPFTVFTAPTVTGNAPNGRVGEPYSFTPTVTAIPAPTFALTSGTLPAGLTLNPTTGTISGTPTAEVFLSDAQITATNSVGSTVYPFIFSVNPPFAAPTISVTPPLGAVGTPYALEFISSGEPNPTFTLTAGTLPPGLTFSSFFGQISGTPTVAGTYSGLVVTATNSQGSASTAPFTIQIDALVTPPTFATTTAPAAELGSPYTFAATALGAGTITYSATGLPAGLSIGAFTGVISGTPAVPGTFSPVVTARNSAGSTDQAYTLLVNLPVGAAPPIISGTPPAATVGVPYSFTFTTTGLPTPTLTRTSGIVPAGLTFDPLTGTLSGTPTTAGPWPGITIVARNGLLPDASLTFDLTVIAPPPLPQDAPGLRRLVTTGPRSGIVSAFTFDTATGQTGKGATQSPFSQTTAITRGTAADVDGDGVADIVYVTGPGGGDRVRILSGVTGGDLLTPGTFNAYAGEDFTAIGLFVAAGDIDGDGKAEIVVAPDQGGGARVQVFRFENGKLTQVGNFFGIDDPAFRGGGRIALGDLNGDGTQDLVVGAGFGGGPRIALFDGRDLTSNVQSPRKLIGDFIIFEVGLRDGVFVAAGDLSGDGKADLLFGGGPGGGPRVTALDGARLLASLDPSLTDVKNSPLANFFAFDSNQRGGVRVAIKNVDDDDQLDIVAGSGDNAPSSIVTFRGASLPSSGQGTPPLNERLDPYSLSSLLTGIWVG